MCDLNRIYLVLQSGSGTAAPVLYIVRASDLALRKPREKELGEQQAASRPEA